MRRLAVAAGMLAVAAVLPARAETLHEVLAEVHGRNPTVNAARRNVRATQETVTQAAAGWKPSVKADADIGLAREREVPGEEKTRRPNSASITISQPIFDGFRTSSSVRQAEANLAGASDGLRNSVQNVLQDAVQAYVDIVRDVAIVELRRRDLEVLTEQVRVARVQLRAGDIRPTDVAQTEARRSGSLAALSLAEANLRGSRASFVRVVGRAPGHLAEPQPVDFLLPRSLKDVLAEAEGAHPALQMARAQVAAAEAQVGINESELYPKVNLEGQAQKRHDPLDNNDLNWDRQATIMGRVTVPIFDGGLNRAKVREALETLEQRRLELEAVRAQIEATATVAWSTLISARAQIDASLAQIKAAESALQGVLAEARGGLRTQLDTLNAQKELLDARVALISAKHDRVLASYALLAAAGRLDIETIGQGAARPWSATVRGQQR